MCSEDDNSSDAFQQLDMVDEHVLTGDCSSLNSMAGPGRYWYPAFSFFRLTGSIHNASLQDLGRVIHDYAGVSMEFMWQEVTIHLQGEQSPRLTQHSLARRFNTKTCMSLLRPFPVLERIGAVAYRLQLPDHGADTPQCFMYLCYVHFRGPDSTLIMHYLQPWMMVDLCLFRWLSRTSTILRHGLEEQVLVQWSDGGPSDATWEPATVFLAKYPNLAPRGRGGFSRRG
nr:Retrotransposable element Tf2 [Ipomoea batatas]